MPSKTMAGAESKTRLRASCNACNESKVRCSQTKPTCTRCERNELECIYGLSRRTHKDAPPIAVPPPRRGRKPRSGTSSRPATSGGTTPSLNASSPDVTATESTGCTALNGTNGILHHEATRFQDYMFPVIADTNTAQVDAPMLDFNGLLTGCASSTAMTPEYLPTIGADYTHPMIGDFEFPFNANQDSNTVNIGAYQASNDMNECTCHTNVMELLTMMRGGSSGNSYSSRDQQPQIDTQLAKMKQCIIASEMSMSCTHSRDDAEPTHIMAVAMLIGYAIDDFKVLASQPSSRRSSSLTSSPSLSSLSTLSTVSATPEVSMLGNTEMGNKYRATTTNTNNNVSTSNNFPEPKLSWGILELEEDDEMDLRHRLYLLSFRKLERLLLQLTAYIQDLHGALVSLPDPSRHMAFVIVCDYTRLWLEKKATDVKKLLSISISTRDELMDPVFV